MINSKSIYIFTLFLFLFCSIPIDADSPKKQREAFGVLIKVKKADLSRLSRNKDFLKLKSRYRLKNKEYFRIAELLQMDSPPHVTQKHLQTFCSQVKKIKEVIYCDLNQKVKLDINCESRLSNNLYSKTKEIFEITQNNCVFPKPKEAILPNPDYPGVAENTTGLDAFWVQEYIGADLLREELEALDDIAITNDLVQIWDSNSEDHGEKVSQLIAGPLPSAIIPQSTPLQFKQIGITTDDVEEYENAYRSCQAQKACPRYIANSMSWGSPWEDQTVQSDIFHSINEEFGTVVVTSAGNRGSRIDRSKEVLAAKGKLIMVGSLDPLGDPSDFSNHSPEITISVPSDKLLRSYDFQNRPTTFGGSSGGQPFVTGSLATFTKITGYPLNVQQAKTLLQKTALPFPRLPSSNSMGAGMLNAYKIGAIAFKLKKACQSSRTQSARHRCIASGLNSNNTYQFDVAAQRRQVMADARGAFPSCVPGYTGQQTSTCEDQIESFKKLRRMAFLNPSDQRAWEIISCINRENGLTKHAEFYARLANRVNLSDEDIIRTLIAEKKYEQLAKYAVSTDNINTIITALLNENDVDDQTLAEALNFIESYLEYEDISNFEETLRRVSNHRNADWRTFGRVDDLIKKHFDKINNPEQFLTGFIQDRNSPIPVNTIAAHIDKLADNDSLWTILMDSEKITEDDLSYITAALVSNHARVSRFQNKLDELLNHPKIDEDRSFVSAFAGIVNNYNDIPNANRNLNSIIDNDRISGGALGIMGRSLIRNFHNSSDFADMLNSIMNHSQADNETLEDIAYAAIANNENFRDFPGTLQAIMRREKINERGVGRATQSFIANDVRPEIMQETWQAITNNSRTRENTACSRATNDLIFNMQQNREFPYMSEKSRLIYGECVNKMNSRNIFVRARNMVQNFHYDNVQPRQLEMLRFLINQETLTSSDVNRIYQNIQRINFHPEIARSLRELIENRQTQNR